MTFHRWHHSWLPHKRLCMAGSIIQSPRSRLHSPLQRAPTGLVPVEQGLCTNSAALLAPAPTGLVPVERRILHYTASALPIVVHKPRSTGASPVGAEEGAGAARSA